MNPTPTKSTAPTLNPAIAGCERTEATVGGVVVRGVADTRGLGPGTTALISVLAFFAAAAICALVGLGCACACVGPVVGV